MMSKKIPTELGPVFDSRFIKLNRKLPETLDYKKPSKKKDKPESDTETKSPRTKEKTKACWENDDTTLGLLPRKQSPQYFVSEKDVMVAYDAGSGILPVRPSRSKPKGRAFIEKTNENEGLHYIAARDLDPGTELFVRNPLVVVPRVPDAWQFSMSPYFIITKTGVMDKTSPPAPGPDHKRVCLGCCRYLMPLACSGTKNDYRRCSKCKWPLCGKDCELGHHKEECEIFVARRVSYDLYKSLGSRELYSWIGILRAVLLKKNVPGSYDRLHRLQLHHRVLSSKNDLKMMKRFLFDVCRVHWIDEQEVERVYLALWNNTFIGNHRPNSFDTRYCYIVYDGGPCGKGMVLSHSCIPNCIVHIRPETFEGSFRTITEVKKGEILSICYDPKWPLEPQPLVERHRFLERNWYKPCKCRLCDFFNEGGSYLSGMRCSGCGRYVSPSMIPERKWHWHISCGHCRRTVGLDEARGAVGEKIFLTKLNTTTNLWALTNLIDRFRSNSLVHPGHFLLMSANYYLAMAVCLSINIESANAGAHKFQEFVPRFETLFAFMDKFQPGKHYWRASFEFHYAHLLLGALAKKFEEGKLSFEQLDEEIAPLIDMFKDNSLLVLSDPMSTGNLEFKNLFSIHSDYTHHLRSIAEERYGGELRGNAYPRIRFLLENNCISRRSPKNLTQFILGQCQ